jgi:hypothetical protein
LGKAESRNSGPVPLAFSGFLAVRRPIWKTGSFERKRRIALSQKKARTCHSGTCSTLVSLVRIPLATTSNPRPVREYIKRARFPGISRAAGPRSICLPRHKDKVCIQQEPVSARHGGVHLGPMFLPSSYIVNHGGRPRVFRQCYAGVGSSRAFLVERRGRRDSLGIR